MTGKIDWKHRQSVSLPGMRVLRPGHLSYYSNDMSTFVTFDQYFCLKKERSLLMLTRRQGAWIGGAWIGSALSPSLKHRWHLLLMELGLCVDSTDTLTDPWVRLDLSGVLINDCLRL